MRQRIGLLVGAAGCLSLMLALTMGAGQDEPNPSASEIAREQVKLAQEALEVVRSEAKHGINGVGAPEIAIWSRRLVQAERETGDEKMIRDTLQSHLARMQQNLEFAKEQFQAGQVTISDVLDARFALNEARLWVAKNQQARKP